MGRAMRKRVCGHMLTAEAKSACAFVQSDQGLHCPQTESSDTIECINGQQWPGRYFAHVPDDLGLRVTGRGGRWNWTEILSCLMYFKIHSIVLTFDKS